MIRLNYRYYLLLTISTFSFYSLADDRSCIGVRTQSSIGGKTVAIISNNCGSCKSGDVNIYRDNQYDNQGTHFKNLTNGSEMPFEYSTIKPGSYFYVVMNVQDCSSLPKPPSTPPSEPHVPTPVPALDCPGPVENTYPFMQRPIAGQSQFLTVPASTKTVELCVSKVSVPVVDHVLCTADIFPPNINENKYKEMWVCKSGEYCGGLYFSHGYEKVFTGSSTRKDGAYWCVNASIENSFKPYRVFFTVLPKK
ncbi:hypothetical protein PGS10_14655 [Klebsiella sp. 141153]|uniref:hypothetical protein n=1 Tax=Klebsiella sp. 141153 TaxID=3020033 RepID=UPI0029283502|nr:hypothetical protein [Klebsiella sp. 141153]MDU9355873.1 hypothetical protein [Klebsiella sp. 141153]